MFGPEARRAGLVSAGGAGMLVGSLAALFGWDNFFFADGISFLMIARQLSGHGLGSGDDAYRYGRMLYPFAGLLLAGGHRAWLVWTLPVVNCLAFGAAVSCCVELAVRHGRSVRHGLLILAVPALWMCLVVAWSEALLIALLLGFVLCHEERRDVPAAACLALAILTKETAALVLVPFGVAALLRRDLRLVVIRAAAGVPAVMWWSWTRIRLGAWPFLAETPSRTLAVGSPLVGITDLWRSGVTAIHVTEIALVGFVALTAIGIWIRRPSSVVGGAAAISGAFSLCLGPNVLNTPGDTLRVLSPTLALLLAARIVDTRAGVPVPDEATTTSTRD
jgi:hypothetical protein